jgi:hypothetical protein
VGGCLLIVCNLLPWVKINHGCVEKCGLSVLYTVVDKMVYSI